MVPYGLMMSYDENEIWRVRRDKASGGYRLISDPNRPFSQTEEIGPDFQMVTEETIIPVENWSVELPTRPRAMVRAGDTLLFGGMPLATEESDLLALYAGQEGGLICMMSTIDGTKLGETKLDSPPTWDGMAVVDGRLYMSTSDGHVLCLGDKK